jgi:hypothetical protein
VVVAQTTMVLQMALVVGLAGVHRVQVGLAVVEQVVKEMLVVELQIMSAADPVAEGLARRGVL